MNEKLRSFYDQLIQSNKLDGLPDFNTFQEKLNNPQTRKSFHKQLIDSQLFEGISTDFNEFENKLELVPFNEVDPTDKVKEEAGIFESIGRAAKDFVMSDIPIAFGNTLKQLTDLSSSFNYGDRSNIVSGFDYKGTQKRKEEEELGQEIIKEKLFNPIIEVGQEYKEENPLIDNVPYNLTKGAMTIFTAIGASAINPGLGIASTYMLEAGGAYETAKEYGLSDEEAALASAPQGLLNSAIEMITPIKTLGNLGVKWAKGLVKETSEDILKKGIWKEALKGGSQEGIQEFIQESVNMFAENVYKSEDDQIGFKDWFMRGGEALLYGAILGGPIRGTSAIIGKKIAKNQIEQNKKLQEAKTQIANKASQTLLTDLISKPNDTYQPNTDLGIIGNALESGILQTEKEYNKEGNTIPNKSILNDKVFISDLDNNIQKELDSSEEYNTMKENISGLVADVNVEPEIKRALIQDLTNYAILNKTELKPVLEQKYSKVIDISATLEKVSPESYKLEIGAYMNNASKQITEKLFNEALKQKAKEEDYVSTKPQIVDDEDLSAIYNQSGANATNKEDITFNLSGSNVQPFNSPNLFNITSKFDEWLNKQQGKINIGNPLQHGIQGFGARVIERFRQEYLAKNNFTSVPKERIQDFKKDWNTWLKENFGLRHKEGSYNDEGLYGLGNIINYSKMPENKGTKESTIQGSEVIISGDFLFNDMAHTYQIGNQEGAGLGWYIYSEVNGEPFIYEWQSDILPDLFGKSVSSTRKFINAEGKNSEIEKLNSGEVRISDETRTEYYKQYDIDNANSARIVDDSGETFNLFGNKKYDFDWSSSGEHTYTLNGNPITKEEYDAASKEFEALELADKIKIGTEAMSGKPWSENIITKQEFEAKKEKLAKQSAEKGLLNFIEQPGFEDHLEAKAHGIVASSDTVSSVGEYNREIKKVYQELLKKELSDKVNVLPALENQYKRYWNTWLMHSFMYAKEKGQNTVWLPTGEAMYEIESSKKTAAMYATKWDLEDKGNFDKVGPYWTALNKIKDIELKLEKPSWSTVPLIKADISKVDTEAYTLFQQNNNTNSNTPYSSYLPKESTIGEISKRVVNNLNPTQQLLLKWISNQEAYKNIKVTPYEFKTNNKASYMFHKGKAGVFINKNAIGTSKDFAESILHESIHTFTFSALNKKAKGYDAQFDDNISQIREIAKNILKDKYEYAFSNNMEFLAEIFANNTELNNDLANIKLEGLKSKNLLEKIIELIKDLFSKHKLDASLLDLLEVEMNKKFGIPFIANKIPNININELTTPNLDLTDKIQDKYEKLADLLTSEIDDEVTQQTLLTTLKETGLFKSTTDIVQNLQGISYNQFMNRLLGFTPLKEQLYSKYDTVDTFGLTKDEYAKNVLIQLWDKINSLRKIPHLTLDINKNTIQILPDNFIGMDGNKQSSYIENMRILEMLPELESIVGSKLKIYSVDHITSGKRKFKITKESQWDNAKYAKAFKSNQYYYLGTFSNKNKSFVIKADNAIMPKLKTFLPIWQQKYKGFIQAKGLNELEYQFAPQDEFLLRLLIEDIKLGGRIDERGNWQTAFFNPEIKESFDFIASNKRSYLVSEMGYTEKDSEMIKDFMKDNSVNSGVYLDKNGLAQIRSLIFDSKNLPEDRKDQISNLINSLGTEKTDGVIISLIRNDKKSPMNLYRQVHGVIKGGVIKPWISNAFKGNQFRNPLYVKSAVLEVNENSDFGIWMKENNIGLLISDTAAKIKDKNLVIPLFSENVTNNIFDIPLHEIQRDHESGEVKEEGFGLKQMITSNFAHTSNISFNKGNTNNVFEKFVNKIIEVNQKKFNNKVGRFSTKDFAKFITNRILLGRSEKAIAAQKILEPLLTENVDLRTLMNHPYFSTEIKNYFNTLLEDYKRFKLPGTQATLQPDLGSFNDLFTIAQKQLTENFGEKSADIMKEAFDDNMNIQKGYTIISSNIAKKHNIKIGDRVMHNAVPSNNFTAMGSSIVVGIAGKNYLAPGAIVMNSEYIQSQVGKDFDDDKLFLHPFNSEYHDKKNYYELAEKFNEISDNYIKDTYSTFERLLGQKYLNDIATLKGYVEKKQEKIVNDKDVRLKYVQYFNGEIAETNSLISPFAPNVYDIMNLFSKKVGDPIHRRTMMQLLAQIGFKTRLGNNEISAVHQKTYANHLLLGFITDDFVDAPSNTNSFYYPYDELEGVKQDLGIKRESIEAIPFVAKAVNDILFRNAINLTGDYWKDDKFESNWDYYLDLIAKQKIINSALQSGNKTKLMEIISANIDPEINLSLVEEYVNNINFAELDFNASPIMKIINEFDFEKIPFVGIEKNRYNRTENYVLAELLNNPKYSEIKKWLIANVKENPKGVTKESPKVKDTETSKFENWGTEKLLTNLWYATATNPKLHKAKAVLLQLLNPDKEYDVKQQGIIKRIGDENHPAHMAMKARDYAYPKLFKLLLEQKAIEFEKNAVDKITIDHNNKKYVFEKKGLGLYINGTNFKNIDVNSDLHNELINPKGAFSKVENRVELDRMFNLRNRINTPYFLRLTEAIEFLNKVMPEFSEQEKTTFWISMLGADPNANEFLVKEVTNSKGYVHENKYKKSELTTNYFYPINTIPDLSSNNIKSNDLLLQIMSQVNDNVPKEILKDWSKSWINNYYGKTFDEINRIKDHINNDEVLEPIIYYQQSDKKVIKESQSLKKQFSNIKGIADAEKTNPYSNQNTNVGYTFDFNDIFKTLSGYDIAKYHFPIANDPKSKSMQLNFNDVHIYEKQVSDLMKQKNKKNLAFQSLLEEINDIKKDILGITQRTFKTIFNSPINREGILDKEIFELVEKNPDNIKLDSQGNYFIGDELIPLTKAELFARINKGEVYNKKLDIALKYQKLYSIDTLNDISTVIKYLSLLKPQLKDTNNELFINNMINYYVSKYRAMEQMKFKYMPHVYSKRIFDTKIKPQIRKQIKKEITEKVEYEYKLKQLNESGDSTIPYNKEYADNYNNSEWIETKTNQELNSQSKYISDSMISFDPFFMKRDFKNLENIPYKMSNEPHISHNEKFYNAIYNDLLLATELVFEKNAINNKISEEGLVAVRLKTADECKHEYFHNMPISYKDIKPGMDIASFRNVKVIDQNNNLVDKVEYISGIVKKVDKDNVFFDVGEKSHEALIRSEIIKYKKISRDVAAHRNGSLPLTRGQLRKINELKELGYLETVNPQDLNTEQASTEILQGLQNQLRDRNNWGKVPKSQLFIEQYVDGERKNVEGVRRHLSYNGFLGDKTGLRSITKMNELENQYGKDYLTFHLRNKSINVSKLGKSFLGGKWVDRSLVYLYLGTLKQGFVNAYRGHAALFINDTFGYTKRYLFPPTAFKAYLERKGIKNDVMTAIKEGTFDKFYNQALNTTSKLEKDRALKRHFALEAIVEEGLFSDIELQRIVAESSAFDGMIKWNSFLDNVKTLHGVFTTKSGYKSYLEAIKKETDIIYSSNNKSAVEASYATLRAIELEWMLTKQKVSEGNFEFDKNKIDEIIKSKLGEIQKLKVENKFDKNALDVLEQVELTKEEALYASMKLGKEFTMKMLLKLFSTAERMNRLSTILYTVTKAVDQGMDLEDSQKLETDIENAVGITQGFYDSFNRRLGDRPGPQRMVFKFSQYPYYNLQNTRLLFKQGLQQVNGDWSKFGWYAIKGFFFGERMTDKAMKEDYIQQYLIKHNLTDIDIQKRTELLNEYDNIHKNDLIKPGEINIPAKMLRQIFAQGWLRSLQIAIPGLALDSYSVWDDMYELIVNLLSIFKDEDLDEDDLTDWDTQMMLNGMLSYAVGIGITLPLNLGINVLLWDSLNPKEKDQKTDSVIPPLIKDISNIYEIATNKENTDYNTNEVIRLITNLKPLSYSYKSQKKGEKFYTEQSGISKLNTAINPINTKSPIGVTLAPFVPLLRELREKEVIKKSNPLYEVSK